MFFGIGKAQLGNLSALNPKTSVYRVDLFLIEICADNNPTHIRIRKDERMHSAQYHNKYQAYGHQIPQSVFHIQPPQGFRSPYFLHRITESVP